MERDWHEDYRRRPNRPEDHKFDSNRRKEARNWQNYNDFGGDEGYDRSFHNQREWGIDSHLREGDPHFEQRRRWELEQRRRWELEQRHRAEMDRRWNQNQGYPPYRQDNYHNWDDNFNIGNYGDRETYFDED